MPVFTSPICPRCGAINCFGIREIEVRDARFRHYAILCTMCGCVVGTESMELTEHFRQIEERLNRAGIR